MRFVGITAALLLAIPAQAVDVHVSSQTVGQGYQLITAGGDVLKRSRLNQFLGLSVLDFMGDNTNSMSFVSSFRFDSDFGITESEQDAIPQLTNNNLSVMYLYLDFQDLGGMIDLRVGRQLLIDELDFTMLDGLRLRYETGLNFGVEVVSGLEVKNAAALGVISSTQLEVDGAPEDEDEGLVIGGALYLYGLRAHHGKLGYRRIMTFDGDLDAERVFGNYHIRIIPQLHLHVGWAYDLVISDISDIRAQIRVPKLGDMVDIELAYLRLVPTFEGSSIFNVFNTMPMNDVDARVRVHIARGISAYVGGYMRLFGNDIDDDDEGDDGIKDFGGRLGGSMQIGRFGNVGLDANYQTGYGDYSVVDLHGGYGFLDGDLRVHGRATAVIWEDIAQPTFSATSFGGLLGLSYQIRNMAKFHLISEINSNKIESLQYRMYGLVDLDFWL